MATNYFLNQYFSTFLNVGGGIDASQTTGIIVQAVSGLDITKPGIACFSYSDPIDTSLAEWITYTSINGSNELQGVTRGAEGFAAKSHSNQAVVVFPLSESHINTLSTALSIGGVATNGVTTTLDEDDMASNSATALATQQSIKAYVDTKTAAVPTVTFATSGPQATFSTSSTTTVDVTGVTLTITPTRTVTVNASITGRSYGATAGDVVRAALYIDGVKITEVDYAVVIANYGVSFSLVAQASVASGSRVIKMMVHNATGARSISVDQANINVIYG